MAETATQQRVLTPRFHLIGRRVLPVQVRLAKSYRIDRKTGCWLWTKSCFREGYGQFKRARKIIGAHRAMYELIHGPIPKEKILDHLCRVKRCVNPAHLELVRHHENRQRGIGIVMTPEKVIELRRRYRTERISCEKLGRAYGIGMVCAWRIIHGQSWANVKEDSHA